MMKSKLHKCIVSILLILLFTTSILGIDLAIVLSNDYSVLVITLNAVFCIWVYWYACMSFLEVVNNYLNLKEYEPK